MYWALLIPLGWLQVVAETRRTNLYTKHLCNYLLMNLYVHVKQSLYRPWWFQKVEVPSFPDSRQMKVVRLPALSTGHLYPPPTPGNISGTQYLLADEPTPRPQSGRKDYSNGEFQWHHRGSNPRPPHLFVEIITSTWTFSITKDLYKTQIIIAFVSFLPPIIIIIIIIIAYVRAQNIFHGRNNITCSTNCKNITTATLHPRNMVCCRYVTVNTLHTGDSKYDDDDDNNNNNNQQQLLYCYASKTAALTSQSQLSTALQHQAAVHCNSLTAVTHFGVAHRKHLRASPAQKEREWRCNGTNNTDRNTFSFTNCVRVPKYASDVTTWRHRL